MLLRFAALVVSVFVLFHVQAQAQKAKLSRLEFHYASSAPGRGIEVSSLIDPAGEHQPFIKRTWISADTDTLFLAVATYDILQATETVDTLAFVKGALADSTAAVRIALTDSTGKVRSALVDSVAAVRSGITSIPSFLQSETEVLHSRAGALYWDDVNQVPNTPGSSQSIGRILTVHGTGSKDYRWEEGHDGVDQTARDLASGADAQASTNAEEIATLGQQNSNLQSQIADLDRQTVDLDIVSDGLGWAEAKAADAGIALFAEGSTIGDGLLNNTRDLMQADVDGVSQWKQTVGLGATVQAVVVRIEGTLGPHEFSLQQGDDTYLPIYTDTKVLSAGQWDYYFLAGLSNSRITITRRANITHTRFHGELGGRAKAPIDTLQTDVGTRILAGPPFIAGDVDARNIYVSIDQPINAYAGADTLELNVQGTLIQVDYDASHAHQVLTLPISAVTMRRIEDNGELVAGNYILVEARIQKGDGTAADAIKLRRRLSIPVVAFEEKVLRELPHNGPQGIRTIDPLVRANYYLGFIGNNLRRVEPVEKFHRGISVLWPNGTTQPLARFTPSISTALLPHKDGGTQIQQQEIETKVKFILDGYIPGFQHAWLLSININGDDVRGGGTNALVHGEYVDNGRFRYFLTISNFVANALADNQSAQTEYLLVAMRYQVPGDPTFTIYQEFVPMDYTGTAPLAAYIPPEAIIGGVGAGGGAGLATATPSPIRSQSSTGSGTTAARDDHVHTLKLAPHSGLAYTLNDCLKVADDIQHRVADLEATKTVRYQAAPSAEAQFTAFATSDAGTSIGDKLVARTFTPADLTGSEVWYSTRTLPSLTAANAQYAILIRIPRGLDAPLYSVRLNAPVTGDFFLRMDAQTRDYVGLSGTYNLYAPGLVAPLTTVTAEKRSDTYHTTYRGQVSDEGILNAIKAPRTSADRAKVLATSTTNEDSLILIAPPTGGGGGSLTNSTPEAVKATGAAGTDGNAARADHAHALELATGGHLEFDASGKLKLTADAIVNLNDSGVLLLDDAATPIVASSSNLSNLLYRASDNEVYYNQHIPASTRSYVSRELHANDLRILPTLNAVWRGVYPSIIEAAGAIPTTGYNVYFVTDSGTRGFYGKQGTGSNTKLVSSQEPANWAYFASLAAANNDVSVVVGQTIIYPNDARVVQRILPPTAESYTWTPLFDSPSTVTPPRVTQLPIHALENQLFQLNQPEIPHPDSDHIWAFHVGSRVISGTRDTTYIGTAVDNIIRPSSVHFGGQYDPDFRLPEIFGRTKILAIVSDNSGIGTGIQSPPAPRTVRVYIHEDLADTGDEMNLTLHPRTQATEGVGGDIIGKDLYFPLTFESKLDTISVFRYEQPFNTRPEAFRILSETGVMQFTLAKDNKYYSINAEGDPYFDDGLDHDSGLYVGDRDGYFYKGQIIPDDQYLPVEPRVVLSWNESRAYADLVLPADYTNWNELLMIVARGTNSQPNEETIILPTSALSSNLSRIGESGAGEVNYTASTRTFARQTTSGNQQFRRFVYVSLRP